MVKNRNLNWDKDISYEDFCSENDLTQRDVSSYAFVMYNFFNERYIYERYELMGGPRR